jgi:hypothetical protein
MQIQGRCHCGNVSYTLNWPDDATSIPARACDCDFCTKHGAQWTAHPKAELSVHLEDPVLISRYRFATKTADFFVCVRCGVAPFVACEIEESSYAVVNVNTLENIDSISLVRSTASFDGEGKGDRLARRKRNWIQTVRLNSAKL